MFGCLRRLPSMEITAAKTDYYQLAGVKKHAGLEPPKRRSENARRYETEDPSRDSSRAV